ncbi:unnamed protein product [Urochloa humidicola]
MPMAVESWLSKVRSAMSSSASGGATAPAPRRSKSSSVGILAFEVGSVMSKVLHLWRAVGDAAVARLRHETIHLDGVRKVVSEDEEFLLGLARAELVDALRAAADSVAALAARCADPALRDFRDALSDFADTGRDRHRWVVSCCKDMHRRMEKMEKQVAATTALRRAMEDLADAEHGLRKLLHVQQQQQPGHRRSLSASKISVAADQQQLVFSKRQEVKHLKQTSLWACILDAVVASLARAAFTTLARINLVFSAPAAVKGPPVYHRSLTMVSSSSSSAAVHPSSADAPMSSRKSMSMVEEDLLMSLKRGRGGGFFEESSAALTPPPGTLGAAALAPRYAAVVISIERMARSLWLLGPEGRDELYGMLPASVRAQLRARLRGAVAAADPGLAGQWRAALAGILDWLAPMAHATMRWQADRSFDHRTTTTAADVLLLQTLHMADRHKVDAAVVELLVGLNYVWRFHITCRAAQPLMPMEQ